jgi:KAP family P-loop domain
MLIRPKKLPIDPANPFALDKLGRDESATLLTQLLERVDTPFVLSIDARWGDGKTTFVEMWRHHLAANQIRSLYFNAWESDYSADPLISFIGEMEAQLVINKDITNSSRLSKAWEQFKEMGVSIAKHAVPVAVKIVTHGALNLDPVIEQALAGGAADFAKEKIGNYKADKDMVRNFKERLGEFLKELGGQNNEGNRPVVFFVDELDRCRPTYTVELLERIKHFFDVEGLAFVLSLDKEQLGHSIQAVYGAGIDVDGYLRRFIDLEYRLPKGKSYNFVAFLADQYQLRETVRRSAHSAEVESIPVGLETFEHLASVFNLSLRKQEQTMAMLVLVLLTSRLEPHLTFLISLAVMKVGNPEFYDGLIASRVTVKDVLDRLEASPAGKKFLTGEAGELFEASLIGWKMNSDRSASERHGHYQELAQANQGKHVEAPRAQRILNFLRVYSRIERVAASFIRALEITGQFKSPPETPANLSVQ